ncbi:MAG TPA: TatD family hydrolase [Candidatus Lokiarchaeia archaeon]|nr:TatD family hydrolase [Candidatus Lokiarchaeia archaeon]
MGKSLNIPEPEPGLSFCDVHCHVPWTEGTISSDKGMSSLPPPEMQIEELKERGGLFFISSSIDLNTTRSCLEFVKNHEEVYFTCGMGPQAVTYTKKQVFESQFEEWLSIMNEHADFSRLVAFGEIGLDFHHAKTSKQRERQINELDRILSIVVDKGKPIVFHVRNAGPNDKDPNDAGHPFNEPDAAARQILTLVETHGIEPSRVLFHCYSGPASLNDELAARGFWFSVPSSAFGFDRWYKVSMTLPVERLMTETDAPFQHPRSMEPINMPSNARYAIAVIAQARGLDQATVAGITLENAKKFFGIQS